MRMLMIPALLALVAGCSGAPKEATQREQIGQSWKYETAGTQGNQAAVAYIGSTNSVQTMTAPDTFSVLLVQPMANGEKEVTVKLVGAPFTCDMSNCTVTARADDGKTLTWQGRLTENRDGIAIMPSQNAYEAIAKARVVKVDLKVGPDDKTFPFAFDVAGLALKS